MKKWKKAGYLTGILISGFIGAGACFSGVFATGALQEITAYAAGEVEINATIFSQTYNHCFVTTTLKN